MSRIRIVGRARGGRCVYCHDGLSSQVDRCPECQAAWHEDCAPEGAKRCPTIGCAGPPPAHTSRPAGRRDRVRHEARRDGGAPAWTRGWQRPGPGARFGPYSRLVMSGLFHAAVVLAVAAIVLWCLLHPHDLWVFLSTGKRHSHEPWPVALLKGLMFGAFLLGGGAFSTYWLTRLPRVAREVEELLERTTPVLMDLKVWSTGSGKQRRTYGTLTGRAGEFAAARIDLQFGGIVSPGWAMRQRDAEPVLVYGLPPPGPYILEFQGGHLALVNADG